MESSRLEQGIVPLAEIEGQVIRFEELQIQLLINLGFGPEISNQIGIDIDYIRKLCVLAGIDGLRIFGRDQLEKDNVQIINYGVGEDGAISGYLASNPTLSNRVDKEKSGKSLKCYRRVQLTIELNKADLLSQIQDVRDMDEMVRVLNKFLRSPLLKEGVKHLLTPNGNNLALMSSLMVGMPWLFHRVDRLNISYLAYICICSVLPKLFDEKEISVRVSFADIAGMEVGRAIRFLQDCVFGQVFYVMEEEDDEPWELSEESEEE